MFWRFQVRPDSEGYFCRLWNVALSPYMQRIHIGPHVQRMNGGHKSGPLSLRIYTVFCPNECQRKHSHKSRTCTQSMNAGWYKWDLIKSYKRKTTSRDTIPGWCPTAVLKEYWSFIALNKHENKSHACLSPLDVTYVCELSVTCTDSRCTSQVSSSQQTEVWERPFCTSATGKHEAALQDVTAIFRLHKGAFCFVPFEQVFPTAKAAQSPSGCSP